VDDEGLVIDRIPRDTKLVYVTPSHQYPLGIAMTLERRRALLEWAERNDAAILEDDYDSEFRFGGRPIEPVQTLDRSGRVLYVGSFSKSLLPTLRLGFIVVPPSVRDAVHRAKYVTDWHSPLAAQAALARFIDDGAFAQHVRKVRGVYATRRDRIIRALERDFREHLEVIPSCAGLHLSAVARQASVRRIQVVVRRASEQGVEVQELAHFAVGAQGQAGIVLGYGAIPTARIDEGLRRLRSSFDGR
jgi:GntR family transcriptional regulator/MocR family aminotransferase